MRWPLPASLLPLLLHPLLPLLLPLRLPPLRPPPLLPSSLLSSLPSSLSASLSASLPSSLPSSLSASLSSSHSLVERRKEGRERRGGKGEEGKGGEGETPLHHDRGPNGAVDALDHSCPVTIRYESVQRYYPSQVCYSLRALAARRSSSCNGNAHSLSDRPLQVRAPPLAPAVKTAAHAP